MQHQPMTFIDLLQNDRPVYRLFVKEQEETVELEWSHAKGRLSATLFVGVEAVRAVKGGDRIAIRWGLSDEPKSHGALIPRFDRMPISLPSPQQTEIGLKVSLGDERAATPFVAETSLTAIFTLVIPHELRHQDPRGSLKVIVLRDPHHPPSELFSWDVMRSQTASIELQQRHLPLGATRATEPSQTAKRTEIPIKRTA